MREPHTMIDRRVVRELVLGDVLCVYPFVTGRLI